MQIRISAYWLAVLSLVLLGLFLGCGKDDGGSTTNIYTNPDDDDTTGGDDDDNTSDDDDDDDTSPGDDDDDDDSTSNTIGGKVFVYVGNAAGSTIPLYPYLQVEALDNVTLSSFSPAVTTTTSESGYFTLTLPEGTGEVALRLGQHFDEDPYSSVLVFDVAAGTTA